jgi:hypothetical protein
MHMLDLYPAEDNPETFGLVYVILHNTLAPAGQHPHFRHLPTPVGGDIRTARGPAWYRIENGLIYPTAHHPYHPAVEVARPHYRISFEELGNVYTTAFHPCGVAGRRWYWIR